MRREFWLSTPAYTGLAVFERGVLVGGMATINWARGKSLDWLHSYFERRWPGLVSWYEYK